MNKCLIRVGLASCGLAAGGRKVWDALSIGLDQYNVNATLKQTGCIGMCYNEVLVEVVPNTGKSFFYKNVTPEKVDRIIQDHLVQGNPVDEWLVTDEELDCLLNKQTRLVLRRCGVIDPELIQEYLDTDGYKALEKALFKMTPQQVIDEITKSGLRGRGGAGFSTGTKWSMARKSPTIEKYVVCNADEGDPGAFMNRTELESDPHSIIEGMLIAGYATEATEGFIYCRAEYPLAIKHLEIALAQARENGFVGEGIMGSNFDFEITIRQGAGAFVCGEETALMMSIEGKRGMPRIRPPFPAQAGLWGKPTNINNVETYSIVPWIILNGADAYRTYGTEKSKGTKVFSLAGKINRPGLVEVPLGTSLREIVLDIGNGTPKGLAFKAVQIGGPSGGVIPARMADTPVDYEAIPATGAIMGSGGLIVMDESSCMVDIAKFFLKFTQSESCGKCTFCRIGTLRMLEILERITAGEGKPDDIEKLERLAKGISRASLCGLGQTAPNPVLTTLKYFRDEYEAHIFDKKCPAKKCQALITYEIIPEKCVGCGLCMKYCAVGAISGIKKAPHRIDPTKCIRCGLCMNNCNVKAVYVY
jgi:NADH-quinone oxidoreductase subunit F